MIDAANELRVSRQHLNKIDAAAHLGHRHRACRGARGGPPDHQTAQLKERLGPGYHAFWAVGRTIHMQKIDMRPQPLEVTAQEILTKDRVASASR